MGSIEGRFDCFMGGFLCSLWRGPLGSVWRGGRVFKAHRLCVSHQTGSYVRLIDFVYYRLEVFGAVDDVGCERELLLADRVHGRAHLLEGLGLRGSGFG